MVSTRTKYRLKRIELMKSIIDTAINCLVTLEKRQLETINLPDLKRLSKQFKEMYESARKTYPKNAGIHE